MENWRACFWLLFSTRQKVTLGIGRFRLGASLVTASAGVSAWRGRLFGSLFEACGACFCFFFYPSEGYLRQWQVQAGGFARHSLCWCFGVARPAFWKPFRGLWGLFLASFFYPSEGYLRQWQVQAGGFARHSLCWCFGVARPAFWKPFRSLWGLFLASFFYPSEGYLRQWQVQAGGFARHSLCGVARPAFWKPFRSL